MTDRQTEAEIQRETIRQRQKERSRPGRRTDRQRHKEMAPPAKRISQAAPLRQEHGSKWEKSPFMRWRRVCGCSIGVEKVESGITMDVFVGRDAYLAAHTCIV